jgi:TPP-dependent pyruvate/acetoin dehydrogenase alpha subunit
VRKRTDHSHSDGGGQHMTAWSCELPLLRLHDEASPRLQGKRNPHIETRCFVPLKKGQEATTPGRQPSERLKADVLAGCLQRALFVLLRVGHKAMEKPSLLPSPLSQRLRITTTVRKLRGRKRDCWKARKGGMMHATQSDRASEGHLCIGLTPLA